MTNNRRPKHLVIQGVPASPGYSIGPLYLLRPEERVVKKRHVSSSRLKSEILRFKKALEKTKRELEAIKRKISKNVGKYEASIFDSHVMILEDEEIVNAVLEDIEQNHYNAEYAFNNRMTNFMHKFDNISGGFLRDRMSDLRDISDRVIDNLMQSDTTKSNQELGAPVVVMTYNLSPSGLSQFNLKNTLGLITEIGGKTSHVAILARSMEIPAVSGINWQATPVEPGQTVIVDGSAGLVILNPTLRDIKEYEIKKSAYFALEKELFSLRDLDSSTTDGKTIELSANIELPVEVEGVLQHGATSIGLYRSEFLFLTRDDMPTEEEQFQAYRYIGERMAPRAVTIRTLDAGGDKIVHSLKMSGEANPFMGWRSIRVCLDNKGIFKNQLRAILRASSTSNFRIMFPMISNLNEIREAIEVLEEVKAELDQVKVPYHHGIEVGCMIEVPSAVIMADELAREVDFFSIGTNDLIQFTLAVDRSNEKIADMFEPQNPAVLRMIQSVIQAARKNEIKVSVCGEMAADPYSAIVLIGLGVDELSMASGSILEMKKFIRSISFAEAKEIADTVLKMTTAEDINDHLKEKYRKRLDELHIMRYHPQVAAN